MAQFYLLSFIANLVAGLALSSDFLAERVPFLGGLGKLREKRGSAITLGLVTAVVGVLKLIFKSPGETVAFAGDLLPGLVGISLGAVLLTEAFQQKTVTTTETAAVDSKKILSYRVPIGIAGVAVALIHAIMPGVVIL